MDINEAYERRLEANRKYRLTHKEGIAKKAHEYYLKNRERLVENQRERNAKSCDDMNRHRQTLKDEMARLIATFESRIEQLEGQINK